MIPATLACMFVYFVCTAIPTLFTINARRMRTRVTVFCLSVCLFVCSQSPGFFSRLYDKLYVPECSSLVNPRRAHALAMVTVVGLCVCVSVCLSGLNLLL